ncbi:MAG: GroES family chaperonin [Bacteroidota bacterium]
MMRELQPLNEHVLLEVTDDKSEQKTASGIIIPNSAKAKQPMAKVAAVSAMENAAVVAGDTVMYKEFAGSEIELEGKKFILLPYADILAKVVETDTI